jgi:threonine/homoserine/homoserine lactone efflux protein
MTLPDTDALFVFAAACVALYLAPGPDMLYIASRSLGQGRRAGLLSCLGIATGLLVHMTGAALGLSTLLVLWPLAYTIVKWLGVAYLLYLGVRMFLERGEVRFDPAAPVRDSAWRIMRQGFFVNLMNPKIALFFLAFLPQFVDPTRGDFAAQMFFFGLLFNAGGFLWIVALALGFGGLGSWMAQRPQLWTWQRRITGGLLVGLALQLALSERR